MSRELWTAGEIAAASGGKAYGDWAVIDADGQWYLAGRSDDTIKVSGRRIGPAEIESVLMSHPGVVLAAAIGVPEPVKGEEIVEAGVPESFKVLVKELRSLGLSIDVINEDEQTVEFTEDTSRDLLSNLDRINLSGFERTVD